MQKRFSIRVAINDNIVTAATTNNEVVAMEKERQLAKVHGKDNVWVADALIELIVG